MTLVFKWDSRQLAPLVNGSIERATFRALKMAGGDAVRALKVESSRKIRSLKRLKVAAVNKALPTFFPSGKTIDSLTWKMKASGQAISLSAFPHRQLKGKTIGRKGRKEYVTGGVSVQLNAQGPRTLIRSAFVATMKSGHKGIFRRRGDKRLPIDEAFGPTVAALFHNAGFVPGVSHHALEKFGASFARLLPLELKKAAP